MFCHSQHQIFSLTFLVFLLFTLTAQPATAKLNSIYRCPQLNAPPLFSGTPCPSARPIEPTPINGYAPPTLTPAEQRQLDQQRLHQQTRQQPRRRKAAQKLLDKERRAAATTSCKRHQEALRALQSRRRKGYKLTEATRLDHQEQGLRQNIRLHC